MRICRKFENWRDLRSLSGKFLRQETCYPESFCFLWLCCDQLYTFSTKSLQKGWKGGGVLGELCKGCRDFQWIFVRISSESPPPPWGTIGLFGESYCHSTKLSWAVEGQRETKMQVGQTAALAVLSSIKGTFLIHSSLWYLLDHLQNHSLSSRFLIDWMSDLRKLIPILRCT